MKLTNKQRKALKEEGLDGRDLRYIKSIKLKEKTKKVLTRGINERLYVDKNGKLKYF